MNEQKKTKGAKWFGIPNLVPYMRPYGKLIFWMVLMAFYGSAMDAVIPLFQQYAIDHYIADSDPCGARLVHRRCMSSSSSSQTASNYISAFGACKAGAVRRPRSQARELQPSADALVLLLQPEQRRLCPRARHVRYRPHCDARSPGALMEARVACRRISRCAIVMMFVLNWKLALCVLVIVPIAGDLVHVLPEEARVLPPAGARAKLPASPAPSTRASPARRPRRRSLIEDKMETGIR